MWIRPEDSRPASSRPRGFPEGGTPLAYVVDLNLNRRSYTPSQRAALAEEFREMRSQQYRARSIANLKQGVRQPDPRVVKSDNSGPEAPANARDEAAGRFNVSTGLVAEATKIRKVDPELFEAVKSGATTISAAKREIAKRAPQVHEAPPEPSIEEVGGRLAADINFVPDFSRYKTNNLS